MDESLRETTTMLACLRAAAVASRDSAYPRPPTAPPAGGGYLLRRALILADLDAMDEVLASCTSAWSVNVSGQGGKRNAGGKGRRDFVPDSEDESSDEEDAKESEGEEEQELQRVARPDDDDDDDDDDNAAGARQVPGPLTERGQGQSGAFACLERHERKLGGVGVVWDGDAQSRDADTHKTDVVRKARLVGLGGEGAVVVMVGVGGNEDVESGADGSTSSFHCPRSAPTNTKAVASTAPQTAEDGSGGGKKLHDKDSIDEQEGLAAVLTERELGDLVQEINALRTLLTTHLQKLQKTQVVDTESHSVEQATGTNPRSIVQSHIRRLGRYNSTKDVAQELMGLVAENRGVPVASLYTTCGGTGGEGQGAGRGEFGVGAED